MNLFKRVLLQPGMLMLAISFQSWSDTDNEAPVSDVSIFTPSSDCRFSGTFKQEKLLSGLTMPIKSSGRFLYDCSRGVIWEAQQPEPDTLVLLVPAKSANSVRVTQRRAYRIYQNNVRPLKGRQSKFLSQLIMSLMAGDQTALKKQFTIIESDNKIQLLPKRSGLKRAIKRIDVAPFEGASTDGSGALIKAKLAMSISILDRNTQTTVITAWRDSVLPELSLDTCKQAELDLNACELLFPPIKTHQ